MWLQRRFLYNGLHLRSVAQLKKIRKKENIKINVIYMERSRIQKYVADKEVLWNNYCEELESTHSRWRNFWTIKL